MRTKIGIRLLQLFKVCAEYSTLFSFFSHAHFYGMAPILTEKTSNNFRHKKNKSKITERDFMQLLVPCLRTKHVYVSALGPYWYLFIQYLSQSVCKTTLKSSPVFFLFYALPFIPISQVEHGSWHSFICIGAITTKMVQSIQLMEWNTLQRYVIF